MKTKILFVLPKTTQGGAETQLMYLIKGIDKNKFDVTLGLLYADEHLKEEFHQIKNLNIVRFEKKGSLDLSVFAKIAHYIRENDIDIVQTFLGNHHSYIPCVLAGKAIPVGGVRNTFDDTITFSEKVKEFIIPKMLASRKRFYLVSNSITAAKSFKGFAPGSIAVIPNGIIYEKFSKGNGSKIRKELKLGKKIVLGMIARMVPGKNQEMLIKCYLKMTKGRKDVALVLAGDGPEKEKLMQLAESLGLKDDIVFTGNRRDVPDLLAAFDVFLFPSLLLEGWPNSIGEAMAAGLPVVAYDMGDTSRIIDHGKDGYVMHHDDNLFCEYVRRLIKSKPLRKKIGTKAKAKAKSEFPVSKMVKEYEELYARVRSQ